MKTWFHLFLPYSSVTHHQFPRQFVRYLNIWKFVYNALVEASYYFASVGSDAVLCTHLDFQLSLKRTIYKAIHISLYVYEISVSYLYKNDQITQDIGPTISHSMNHVLEIYCWNWYQNWCFLPVKPTVETSKQWMFHSCQVLPIREAIWFMADGVLITPVTVSRGNTWHQTRWKKLRWLSVG